MTYIVQRQSRYYVVAYDGLDPLTGKERRRWHPVGHNRDEAEAICRRLDRDRAAKPEAAGGHVTVTAFLTETWLPRKRREVRATTAYRYAWFIEHYISPAIGNVPLRRLRAHHLDDLYKQLGTTGGRRGDGLAPKTILEVHMIIRAALALAVRRQLLNHNVAHSEQLKLARTNSTAARSWTAAELATFLTAAGRTACTQPCTSPLTPACAAERSSASSGQTSTSTPDACRSRGHCNASVAGQLSSA